MCFFHLSERARWRIAFPVTFLVFKTISSCLIVLSERLGLSVAACCASTVHALSSMIFSHGFVHCDPHPGNILVRQHPTRPGDHQIVLLDHGDLQCQTCFASNHLTKSHSRNTLRYLSLNFSRANPRYGPSILETTEQILTHPDFLFS